MPQGVDGTFIGVGRSSQRTDWCGLVLQACQFRRRAAFPMPDSALIARENRDMVHPVEFEEIRVGLGRKSLLQDNKNRTFDRAKGRRLCAKNEPFIGG